MVHSASLTDREGAKLVIENALKVCPTIQIFWADGGYTGKLIDWVLATWQRILEIIKRSDSKYELEALKCLVSKIDFS